MGVTDVIRACIDNNGSTEYLGESAVLLSEYYDSPVRITVEEEKLTVIFTKMYEPEFLVRDIAFDVTNAVLTSDLKRACVSIFIDLNKPLNEDYFKLKFKTEGV